MFKLYMLDSGPSCEVEISREEMMKIYTQMSRIKEMEGKARELYQQKIIRGFLHLYNGQVRNTQHVWRVHSRKLYTPLSMAYYAYDSTANFVFLGPTMFMYVYKCTCIYIKKTVTRSYGVLNLNQ